MLKGLPTKALNHIGHTSWCSFGIVTVESCSSALNLFQVVDISDMVGVPDSGWVFESWAYHSGVGSGFHWSGAITQISPDKSKGLVCLVHSVVNMLSPVKIFTDGNSRILTTVNHFQGMAMYLEAGID